MNVTDQGRESAIQNSPAVTRPSADLIPFVTRWLTTLVDPSPDSCVELRCLDVVPRHGVKPQTWCGFYPANKLVEMARDALRLTSISRGVYLTLNPLRPELLARRTGRCEYAGQDTSATDADVLRRRLLLVDCDSIVPITGVSASDQEKGEARHVAKAVHDYLASLGWPAPIIGDSGNGYHLFYRIDLPNDVAATKLVRDCLRALAAKFDTSTAKVDTKVSNAGRIVKLPGTFARKGDSTAERRHRRSQLTLVPDLIEVAPLGLLSALADEAPKEASPPAVKAHSVKSTRSGASIIKRARSYLAILPPGIQGQQGNKETFRAAAALVQDFDLPEADAWPLLCEFNSRCVPPWDEGESAKSEDSLRNILKAAIDSPGERGRLLKESRPNSQTTTVEPMVNASSNDDLPEDEDEWTSIIADQGRTDRANSRRFLKAYGNRVRYVFAWGKWLVWDSTRWQLDDGGAVLRLAMAVTDSVWMDAKACLTDDVVKFAIKTSGHASINAMLKLAAADVSIRVDELDANPWLLNCPNGTVDLRTGELRPHRREDMLTKLAPTNFNQDAASLSWDRFLDGVFDGHDPTIAFLQRFAGYCLTGGVSEQVLAVFYGVGSNGKSTLLNALQTTLGTDYTSAAPPSLLMEKKTEAHPTELAGLFGKRLVIAQESSHGARLAESTVKQLTGGDIISARRMREDFWTFTPSHKLVMATNHKPRIKGTDHAIWRRLLLVPFARKYWNPAKGETGRDELKQDKTLPEKLAAEREGILAWMVQGCLDWQRGGLQVPDSIRAATSDYQSEEDIVGRFIVESCVTGNAYKIKFASLFDALTKWCDELGNNLPSRKMVAQWLSTNEYQSVRSNGIWYSGLALNHELDEENRTPFDPL